MEVSAPGDGDAPGAGGPRPVARARPAAAAAPLQRRITHCPQVYISRINSAGQKHAWFLLNLISIADLREDEPNWNAETLRPEPSKFQSSSSLVSVQSSFP